MTIRNYQSTSPTLGERCYIDESAVIVGDVTLGEDASIWPLVAARGDVNYISIGARSNIQDGGVLHHCEVVYDMVYKNSPTRFMRDAAELGVKTQIDGLGMLVEQAAESFYIWTDKQPNTKDVIEYLRKVVVG